MIIENVTEIRDHITNTLGGYMATIDGELIGVPLDPANRHYAEIMRQVEAGKLTIQEADSE